MRRVLVLGPPGSGKSTLARRLGARHGLPVFHLDQIYWQPGWVPAPSSLFCDAVERIAAGPAWVIDGNYSGTLEPRLHRADTVVFLDTPRWLSLPRVLRRTLLHLGRVRLDAAPGCPERFDAEFLRFAWNWNRRSRAPLLARLRRFGGRVVVARDGGRRFAEGEGA